MKTIKFKKLVISPIYGNCAPGSVLKNCGEDFAAHCVNTGTAMYIESVSVNNTQPASQRKAPCRRKVRKTRAAKTKS